MNDITLFENITLDKAPEIYGKGVIQGWVQRMRDEVTKEVTDISTAEGRKRIASLAAKVSRSKTAIEKPGRDYLRHIKEMPKAIEKELREFVDEMDSLRDEVRAPLTEWENKEKKRIEGHESKIVDFIEIANSVCGSDGYPSPSAAIENALNEINNIAVDDSWEEFKAKADVVKQESINKLTNKLKEAKEREAKEAELERLRKAEEARLQAEHEERLKKEAAEAARQEAERKAKERERQHQLELERAERERAEAELKAERAAEAERQRIQAEEERKDAEAKKRAQDVFIKKTLLEDITHDLMVVSDLDAEICETIADALMQNQIRHTTVKF